MKYIEVIKKNRELGFLLKGPKYKIAIISNITINQLSDILELSLREEGINADVLIGDYNVIVQDSNRFSQFHAVLIFWEAINLVEGIQEKSYLMTSKELGALKTKVESELELVLHNLRNVPMVLINCFTSIAFDSCSLRSSPLRNLSKHLNSKLECKISSNQIIVDLDKVLAKVGLNLAIDMRQFQSSKALYSIEFFKEYAKSIKPAFMAINGHSKKVLILDCDNTLWGGILGEDGFSRLQMSNETLKGKVFHEVQSMLLGFKRNGILLALCSKNNMEDVDKVLDCHSEMLLKQNDFIAKKINWQDKASNIQELANELNLGLDSFVFVDDSGFEIGLVEKRLPQVRCIKVPKNLSEYPEVIKSLGNIFFNLSVSNEDDYKTQLYKEERERKGQAKTFNSIDDYLASLNLEIKISWNSQDQVARIAQMSQKTNQFNLVTERYTESQILQMMKDPTYTLVTFSASDNFGDYGVSGLMIIQRDNSNHNSVSINSFLMSCRVIGRNIEFQFLDGVFQRLLSTGVKKISAKYLTTVKNKQVKFFYDSVQFYLTHENQMSREYELDLNEYKFGKINYIRMIKE